MALSRPARRGRGPGVRRGNVAPADRTGEQGQRTNPMGPSDLELYTTKELIDELMRRRTFLGVVVHSEEELKQAWTGERVFKVHFNDNIDAGQALRLLEAVASRLDRDPS
jgi:hypothetical protein